jgi:acyl-CoA reductase-like NAD-dependent aldehyde dehydrogenase
MALEGADFERRIRFLHALAEEVRTNAEVMHDLDSRRTMLVIAASYERMAEHLEQAAEHLSLPLRPSPRLSP